jgi:hypothetical protein
MKDYFSGSEKPPVWNSEAPRVAALGVSSFWEGVSHPTADAGHPAII